jgi:hypothetical protein
MSEEETTRLPVSRRGFLATTVVAATSTAGCSGLTEQSFEAPPVGLPESEHDGFRMAESTVDPVTLNFQGPASTEVEITNHTAVYERTTRSGGT